MIKTVLDAILVPTPVLLLNTEDSEAGDPIPVGFSSIENSEDKVDVYVMETDVSLNAFHQSIRHSAKIFLAFAALFSAAVPVIYFANHVSLMSFSLGSLIGGIAYLTLLGLGTLLVSYLKTREREACSVDSKDFLKVYKREISKATGLSFDGGYNEKYYVLAKDYSQVKEAIDKAKRDEANATYLKSKGHVDQKV